jgi:single-stranded-DNA-specific exonuclease
LEHANIALDALLAEDVVTATETAVALEKINLRRQDVTARLISEAREQALLQKEYAILVLAGADWPKGVVGIAAGRLAGEFGKPTIVLELGEEYATGSARTYGAFDLVEALKATSSHLTKFGGHKEAAGLTLKSADLEAFKSAIIKYADEVRRASSDSDELILELDAELSANELSLDFFDILEQMAPFGAGNPKPQFWLKNASMLSCKAVGAEGRHVQIVFGVGGVEVQGIAFNQGHIPSAFPVGSSVELAVELLADSWKGLRRFKVRVIDIRALQI